MIDTLPERLQKRLLVSDNGCWLWQGSRSASERGGGYGRVSHKGQTVSVHILVWYLTGGRLLRPKEQLDHECVNRACCNPKHLRPRYQSMNIRLANKRRKRHGQRNSNLTHDADPSPFAGAPGGNDTSV